MSDLIYYKNGEETFRISPPTAGTKCPEMKLEITKMTEIELLKQEIKVLEAKLALLEEMEKYKTPAEEAYKRWWGDYPPTTPSVSNFDDNMWSAFQKGYTSAKEDYKVGEYQPSPQTPEQVADGLRDAMIQAKKDGVFDEPEYDLKERTAPPEPTPNKFLQRLLDGKIDERGYVDLSEPTSSAFRQKLFDGIKSVFYDPDYERTHWKQKVNMAVDEVLTHFYGIIPNKREIVDDFEKGWNSCLTSIEMCMEHTDD